MFIRNNFCHFDNFRFQFSGIVQAIRIEGIYLLDPTIVKKL